MKQDKSSYPSFKANQILSADDLTNRFEYLDEQARLTRANLIGTGIVCGLEPSLKKDGNISISKGYGITTDGYIIGEDVSSPNTNEDQEIILQFLKKDVKITINGEEEKITCTELFTGKSTGNSESINNNLEPLDKSILSDNIFLLYLDISEDSVEDISPCSGDDGRGGEVKTTVRYLLVSKEELGQIAVNKALSLKDDTSQLKRVPMPRIQLAPDGGADKDYVQGAFKKSIDEVASKVKTALDDAYGLFQLFPTDKYPRNPFDEIETKDAFLEALFNKNPPDPLPAIDGEYFQNYYDFFDDLLKAYEEFRQKGQELLHQCNQSCLTEGDFPRHLVLGAFYLPIETEEIELIENDRHDFRPSSVTATSDTAACIQELRDLFNRLVTIIAYFNPNPITSPTSNDIRLTPSIYGAIPLSEKAVPYYYHNLVDEQTAKAIPYGIWTCRKDNEEGIGYWYDNVGEKYYGYYHQNNWMDYDLEQYNFVRFEGHINQQTDAVMLKLQEFKLEYCLPIEVVALSTGNVENDKCISDSQEFQFEVLRRETAAALQQLRNKLLAISRKKKKVAQKAQAERETAETAKQEADATLTAAAGTADEGAARERAVQAEKELNAAIKKAEAELNAAEKARLEADIAKSAKDTTQAIKFPPESDVDRDAYNKLFVLSHIDSGIAVSFLHWLDTAMATYQHCLRRHHLTSLAAFIQEHPGIQHKSGVPIGGTFILVYDENNMVIADFCLPYRVTQPD